MANTAELSQRDINIILDAMGKELASYGSEFTFIQLRVSAEHFIVPLCGMSVERIITTLKPEKYHLYFEKKLRQFKQGPVDLVLVPIAKDGKEDWDKPYCFEFKMVWLKGIKGNVSGIKRDIEKLSGYNRSCIVAVLFSFDGGSEWAPYAHRGDIEHLGKELVSEIGTPMYEGHEHRIANHEVTGKFKLVAWASGN